MQHRGSCLCTHANTLDFGTGALTPWQLSAVSTRARRTRGTCFPAASPRMPLAHVTLAHVSRASDPDW
jgi:hypothetical protein